MNSTLIFAINQSEKKIEVQRLDDQGHPQSVECLPKEGPFPKDGFNYLGIVEQLLEYELETGDYFNQNGDILDFTGNVVKKCKKYD